MKVVLLSTYHSIPASTAVKAFLQNTLRQKHGIEVVGIVSSSMLSPKTSPWDVSVRFIAKSGWRFAFKSFLIILWQCLAIRFARYFVSDKVREYFELDELAQKYHIPFLEVEDVNSSEVLKFIEKHSPDYLVSCLLYQLAKPPLLHAAPGGAINFHPALFQEHRGTFSSFWTLLKNRRHAGATVHFMTENFDEGQIILQRYFRVYRSDTIHCINQKSARLGGNLLVRALVKLKKKKARLIWLTKAAKILSMPSKTHTALFSKNGKGLIKWRDFFRL
jgi:folate-dependent phosphoribosylglycinamide formyltransferase PurN